MKKILVPAMIVVLSATAVTPIFAQSYRVRDAHGCETWEGERWDVRYGKCMDPGDYYDDDDDDDYYKYHHQAVSTAPVTPVNTTSNNDGDVAVYNWAKNNGLTTAASFRDFRDDSKITRDEVAVIVQRALNKGLFSAISTNNNHVTFTDDRQIANEFKSATSFVQNAGIMRGNRGYFYPKNLLTEYEALVIVARATTKTEISNFDQARAFAARLGKSFDHDDMNDRIDRGDFFELIKKAKERL
jgi:hypothetical protein